VRGDGMQSKCDFAICMAKRVKDWFPTSRASLKRKYWKKVGIKAFYFYLMLS
jgi:hypothetical protein